MSENLIKHQIIIVGGGITGLTLALMLQHLGVDYLLLEAYDSVTPNVGASIGLWANGLRVLEQLGLYDEILAKGQPVEASIFRDGRSGKRFMTRRSKDLMIERHGYPNIFMERHELLCILYGHLIDKDRVHVNQKVKRVETREDSALLYTQDGSVYECEMVVGADGVRSTVRQEMWRNADEKEPGVIPGTDRQNIACEHACIFGTADPTPGISAGEVTGVCSRGTTAGCMGGPNGEVFLFWFWTLPQSKRSCPIDNIPRFGKEEQQLELALAAETVVADTGLRFKEVVERLQYTGVTALPHFVLRRWHYGRIVILGDAAHKFNPLVGQGGNSCIESCVSLVNALQRTVLSPTPSTANTPWVASSLEEAFVAVEEERVDRLTFMVEQCQNAMRGTAWETWRTELLHRYIAPLIPTTKFADFYSEMVAGGLSLHRGFTKPTAPHHWPYEDEVTAKKAESRGVTIMGLAGAVPVAALAAFMIARMLPSQMWLTGLVISSPFHRLGAGRH